MKKVTGGWDGDHGGVIVPIKPIVQKLALFVLAYDDGDKLSFGLYLPETDFTFDTIDLTGDEFAEFSFNAVVKSTDALKKGPNGETGGYALFSPEDFAADGGGQSATVEAGKDIRLAGQPSTLGGVKRPAPTA